jgi:hypothetical protein
VAPLSGGDVAGRPSRRRPPARTGPRVSGRSFAVFSLFLSISVSRTLGPSYGREGAAFRLGLMSGWWCPASRLTNSLGELFRVGPTSALEGPTWKEPGFHPTRSRGVTTRSPIGTDHEGAPTVSGPGTGRKPGTRSARRRGAGPATVIASRPTAGRRSPRPPPSAAPATPRSARPRAPEVEPGPGPRSRPGRAASPESDSGRGALRLVGGPLRRIRRARLAQSEMRFPFMITRGIAAVSGPDRCRHKAVLFSLTRVDEET